MPTIEIPKTVIGVPGLWKDRSDIVTSIVSQCGGYMFAGMVMMRTETKDAFKLEIYEYDPNLRQAFSVAGGTRFTDEDLDAISSHRYCLYLVGDGGSIDGSRKLLHAAHGLLKAGGIAVKIESTGIAHRADQWVEYCANDWDLSLLHAYVTYIDDNGTYYSCGMQNLGLCDAIVEADIGPDEAANLLRTLLQYILVEAPTIKDGETFSIDAEAPRYRLHRQPCMVHPTGDLFFNPFGMWRMTRV